MQFAYGLQNYKKQESKNVIICGQRNIRGKKISAYKEIQF
jgi:hypothetical protein